jgi:DNA-binding LacI/PurR family transcriptional regulator
MYPESNVNDNVMRGTDVRYTLKQLAAELNVSSMTVSRALRGQKGVGEETRTRIREFARQVQYSPNLAARSLVSRRSHALGIIIPNLRHSFWLDMVLGVERVARSASYHVILTHADDDPALERGEIITLVSRRVDALLIASCAPDHNADFLREVESSGVPVLLFDRYGDAMSTPGVYADDYGGAQIAVHHLASLGYTRIAHLAGDLQFSPARDRLAGYRDAVRDLHRPEIVVEAGFGEENGYRGMHRLLDDNGANAVFVVHDPSAIGALHAALDRGLRVPEDIAIVGFANMECAAHVAVPLTTISQPRQELGEALASLALQRIRGEPVAQTRLVLPTHLVVRRSCGAYLLAAGTSVSNHRSKGEEP